MYKASVASFVEGLKAETGGDVEAALTAAASHLLFGDRPSVSRVVS